MSFHLFLRIYTTLRSNYSHPGGMILINHRLILILGIGFCIIFVAGCQKNPEDIFITAQKNLNGLESYYATITYIVMDGEDQREYSFKQWVKKPASFKIQLIAPENLKGKKIMSDGKEILIENSKIEDSLRFDMESFEQQRPLFIGDFLNSFWLSEDVGKKIHIDNEGSEFVVLTCPSFGASASESIQELWLRSPRMIPAKLVTYDGDGDISSLILFEEFDSSWNEGENFFELGD